MQSFIHTVIIVWSFCFNVGHSDEHQAWSLRVSDPSRDGRFLNVPIYYGDWVPITRAKQTIEAVASKIEAATKNNYVRRKDPPPEIITADQPEDRLDSIHNVPYEVHHPSHHQRQHHWSQPPQQHHGSRWQQPQQRPQVEQWRRNDNVRNLRGHRKLPPPKPFVNQFTSLFQPSLQQQQPVTTQKPEVEVTTTESTGFIGSVFNFLNPLLNQQHKPDIILHDSPVIKTLPAPDLTKVGPPVIELGGGYAEGGEDLYVEQLEAKRRRDKYTHPRQPSQSHHYNHHDHHQQTHHVHQHQPVEHVQHYQAPQHQQTHQTHQTHQGHHVQSHTNDRHDHLASFVDVDFEHFVPGQVEDIDPPVRTRNRHPNLSKHPENFSVLVSGLSKNPDARELAKLFKNGVVEEDKHKAFITDNHVAPPQGFGKVTLPFLDPSEASRKQSQELPSVFIAPVGYKVPAGYKGHPLPYDPSVIDSLTTEEVTLVHSTEETPSPNDIDDVRNPFLPLKPVLSEPEQEVQSVVKEEDTSSFDHEEDHEDVSSPTALVLNKIKLARNRSRAHLASLYKNQESQGPSGAVAPITTIVTDASGRKRKRILTKVVRKPYNPDTTTTPATQKVSDDDVHTVVRIVNPNNADKVDSHLHEEVTESTYTVTTTAPLEDEQITSKSTVEDDYETFTTTAEPYYTSEHFEPTTTDDYTDHEAEPSIEHILFVTSPKPTFQPINFITRKPKITTGAPPVTTPEQTTTTTTTIETSEDNYGYQPTPFSPLDPFKRLRFKATRKPYSPYTTTTDEPVDFNIRQETTTSSSSVTTKKPYEIYSPLLKLRKYGFNQGDKNGRIYGQRIKARRRPSLWANREETYEFYPPLESTSTSTEKPKSEIKSKFRPFFDQLYEQLTGSTTTTTTTQAVPEATESTRSLPYWARPRSTTTANPFTINAEIYEVYRPSSSSASKIEDDQYYDEYYDEDYQAQPRLDNDQNTEYIDEYTTEHETADKHSTTERHFGLTNALPTASQILENYIEPESNFVDSDIQLDFGESQQHQGSAWNEVVPAPERGLDSYSKDFKPSKQIAKDHDTNYQQPNGVFNEHSQQQLHVSEDDFIPFHQSESSTLKPRIPYVELNREVAPIQISIEQVPTNDNDFIANVLEEVYSKIPVEKNESIEVIEEVVDDVQDDAQDILEETDEDIEATTPFVFVTRPTTIKALPTETEVETETEEPATTLIQELEKEQVLSTIETIPETTQRPVEEPESTTLDEPEPTAEVGQESVDDNIIEQEVTNTTPSDFEVTTFRPKSGFLNSLSNFISKFLPSKTTTVVADLTTTTVIPELETSTEPVKLLEVDLGIDELNKIEPSEQPQQETTIIDDIEETVAPTKPEVIETTFPETTEATEPEVPEVEVTTIRFPLRLHRPKTYPPTAKDDYLHLESLRTRTTVTEEQPTTTEVPTSTTIEEISKDVFGAIRREEYFKNWVARKYRKPEDGKYKYTLGEFPTTSSETTTTISTSSIANEVESTTEQAVTENNILFPFAPTVLPKLDDYARRQKKISFLEKLKNSARNSLFNKKDQDLEKPTTTTSTTTTTTTRKPVLYPRGSNLNLFKKWAGGTLSQAEFEKTVLGVSTATEVTVQSRICVRGHCYNADDQAAASSFYKNNFR